MASLGRMIMLLNRNLTIVGVIAVLSCSIPMIGCERIISALPCSGECADGEYCKLEMGACISTNGVCTVIPEVCTEEFIPVCGCDGETYSNACKAAAAGANIASQGACSGSADSCGGLAGVPCEDGFYCQFPEGTCGAADQSGTCAETPEVCAEIFQPVCGCDDQTHENACQAAVSSVSILSQGECVP
ncbi:MAG: hypothetical protein GXP29_04595 [Planctomycetes bacterium]|nr:hypothetical protein [Planctomycetota bacterium]